MSIVSPINFLTFQQFVKIAESIKDNTGHITEYSNDDTCTLLLYPQISFAVNDVFRIFMNE